MLLMKIWHCAALIVLCAGLAVAFLAWLSARDPGINFLPRDARAEWILFPSAVQARAHSIVNLDTVFRRVFTLDTQPRIARLNLRAAKRAELKINGVQVPLGSKSNWKDISTVDVFALLRAGTNTIEARVFAADAPPALWLSLRTDHVTLRSDQTWEASFTGSAWRSAVLASAPRLPRAGNLLAGGEQTFNSLAKVWPIWLAFGGIAVGIWFAGRYWLSRLPKIGAMTSRELSRWQVGALLLIVAGIWICLFWNNSALLPFRVGFDSQSHLEYIKYIQERRALPLPNEGFEMFQPPLYYILSASTLSALGQTTSDAAAILTLRWMTMLFGIAHFTLVFLSLRLLFPSQIGPQLIGLALAAFLPMQLYLAHFVTNETLAATFAAAVVYLSLRLLRIENGSTSGYALLGFFLGAAMLTKTTAVLLVPALFAALVSKLSMQRAALAIWLRTLGVMLAVCFAVCGWHYIRIWLRFGTPFLGNWDPAAGFPWWQDLGYHTLADYFRFGRSLISPLFSGLAGFGDGNYSTLWGDALCAGVADMSARLPWNYDLMVAGYLLALAPTAMIIVGATVAFGRCVRKPAANDFLLLGLFGAVTLGLIFMSLKVASYAQVKAFYGLSMLVPLCFFGAVGWEVVTRRRRLLQFALGIILVVWTMNSFASVWIRHSPAQNLWLGIRSAYERKYDVAASEIAKAVKSDPSNATTRRFLALALDYLNTPTGALEQAEQAVELNPADSACHGQLAEIAAKQGQLERAMSEARRAIELGPENASAHNVLLNCLVQSHRDEEAIAAAADALTVFPFSAETHCTLGVVVARQGDLPNAINQFAYALLLRPDWTEARANLRAGLVLLANSAEGPKHLQDVASLAPDSPIILNDLAWLLATYPNPALRDGQNAVRFAERGCALTGGKNPTLLTTLAAAYAETGRFSDAIDKGEEALSLARSAGNDDIAMVSENLLTWFRANRPYREEPKL